MSTSICVNVVGHLVANSGLGNTARTFARVLLRHGYVVHGIDVDVATVGGESPVEGMRMFSTVDELPSGVNLIVQTLGKVSSLLLRRMPGLLSPRFRNVGLIFWELTVIPSAWRTALPLFDALVACSRYCQQTFEMACPDTPVAYCEHPIEMQVGQDEPGTREVRQRFGIADEEFLAVASFDLLSGVGRKNPFATIKAFQLAFADVAHARLLVKVNGFDATREEALTVALVEAIAADPRMTLVTEKLRYQAVRALYAAGDVYLSLHRSEGLGLGAMEAMAEGTLAIATAHSGNLSFMTEQNSMLVPYRLVPPTDTTPTFNRAFAGAAARWADVDIEAAAEMLRRAHDDLPLRSALAAQARDDIARRQGTAWEGSSLLRTLQQAAAAPLAPKKRLQRRRSAQLADLVHPKLILRNVGGLVWRLRNSAPSR